MLKIDNLSVSYGETQILRDLSMEVRAGEMVCLMGRNGVGKTTLLKSIMGLLRANSGRITFDGKDLTRTTPDVRARAGIGYVPQGREIFPQLTVLENLQVGLLNTRGNRQALLADVLGYFPILKSFLDRKGGFLSGGQQQQLAIARALVMQPKLLILDEPTEGIQPNVITLIGEVLGELKKRGGLSILLVEQYLDFATQLADSYYVMEKGAIVLNGSVSEMDPNVVKPYLAF
ncbi:MAG TPA: urea ABC transporter ATP-binding subunit UrtE [Gemmataceae bacterium]|nr:urea ABC transporter ATP-binding subunit UrtE [Gemmataceae bacterium]